MHDFFPRRSRNELKSKFNREERFNWERLNSVFYYYYFVSLLILLHLGVIKADNIERDVVRPGGDNG